MDERAKEITTALIDITKMIREEFQVLDGDTLRLLIYLAARIRYQELI